MEPSIPTSQSPSGGTSVPSDNSLPPIMADPGLTSNPASQQSSQPTAGLPVDSTTGLPATDPVATEPQVSPVAAGQKYSQHSPAIAEDIDLIEKEWVSKAKAIIASTRGNPAQQSDEINRFKADYLKTRYSKDLKVSEK